MRRFRSRQRCRFCLCHSAEIAAWAKDQGITMYQLLQNIYVQYGFSKEKGISVVKKGKSGAEEIEAMMKHFRENPLQEIAGSKVTLFYDYASLKGKDYVENETLTLDMPTTSNVLQYFQKTERKYLSVLPARSRRSSSIAKSIPK